MKIVRRGTFETNSSSTHSITICKKDEYDRFAEGELLFIKEESRFIEAKDIETYYKEKALMNKFDVRYDRFKNTISYKDTTLSFDNWSDEKKTARKLLDMYKEDLATITEEELESLKEEGEEGYWAESPIDYETYCDYTDSYEYFEEEYESEQGDNIVAFGYYGCD